MTRDKNNEVRNNRNGLEKGKKEKKKIIKRGKTRILIMSGRVGNNKKCTLVPLFTKNVL